MADSVIDWFGVRCVLELDPEIGGNTDPKAYEERVTIWQAGSFDQALQRAWWAAMQQLVTDPSQLDSVLHSLTTAAKTAK
jgi:hypothetical protein